MLTKKHFKAIAEVVNKVTEEDVFTTNDDFRQTISQELANYFVTQNPQFDRQKFLDACGL